MSHPRSKTFTIAIVGADALAEDILARLLEREGYDVRHLDALPTGLIEETLDGVDVMLLAPALDSEVRDTYLGAIRSTAKTAAIPVLPLSSAFKLALLDELSVSASWRSLFEELVEQIVATLTRAAASVTAPLADGSGEPATPADVPG